MRGSILIASSGICLWNNPVIRKTIATVAIGDVHGPLSSLEDLLAKVLPALSRSDILVFFRDDICKGLYFRRWLECIIAAIEEAPCPVVALLGNHEQAMLRT